MIGRLSRILVMNLGLASLATVIVLGNQVNTQAASKTPPGKGTTSKAAAAQGYQCHSRYAGPCFPGQPALPVAASVVAAGGGPTHFSAAKALTAMSGAKVTQAEVAKLTKQYGAANVTTWLKVFDFVVADAVQVATKAGVKFPPGHLKGKALASTLVKTGLDHNTFYIELLLDKMVSHRVHEKVMDDIDTHFGPTADAQYHRISNQAMYDLAHALGAKQVKLCTFH
ncbi:MAG: hypothetical protein JO316_25650 [Abitibacteriaceae bacterium]|nr:hypothetical protein [Abditibacteriaceae bacterium]